MSKEEIHTKLRDQLVPLVEQPESSDTGDWYVVHTSDLLQWTYAEFHFDSKTGALNGARLFNEDIV